MPNVHVILGQDASCDCQGIQTGLDGVDPHSDRATTKSDDYPCQSILRGEARVEANKKMVRGEDVKTTLLNDSNGKQKIILSDVPSGR